MAGPRFSDPTTRWRTTALVLGCLLALYVVQKVRTQE